MVKMIYEQTLTNKQMDVLLFLQDISECLMTAREEDHLEPKKNTALATLKCDCVHKQKLTDASAVYLLKAVSNAALDAAVLI